MANLNIPTIELVSTLRAAPLNGATNSQDYNDSWTESLADLASLSGFINDVLIPILDGLISTIQPIPNTTPNGIEGRFIYSDTTDTSDVFFDSLTSQSLSIADSLRILDGIVQAINTTVANLNVEVTALQTQLSSTNQNDIAQALQNFAASLESLLAQVTANTLAISNNLVTFQTNGTNNGVQNKLNIIAGSNITVINSGGNVTISSSGGSGGGTPGGANTTIQYNNSGSFAGDLALVFDSTNKTISVGTAVADNSISSQIGFTSTSTSPYALIAGVHETTTVNASNYFPTGAGIGAVYTGSAILTNSNVTGLDIQSLQNGTGSLTGLIALNTFAYNENGTVEEINGGIHSVENDATANQLISLEASGGFNLGTITTRLVSLNVVGYENTGTITGADCVGIYLQDQSNVGAANNYGLQILDQTVTGAYAIKTGLGKIDFGGPVTLAIPLAVSDGGTGTTTPSLVAGSNITITGSWPNQTISSTGGGGGGGFTGSSPFVPYASSTNTLTDSTFTFNPTNNVLGNAATTSVIDMVNSSSDEFYVSVNGSGSFPTSIQLNDSVGDGLIIGLKPGSSEAIISFNDAAGDSFTFDVEGGAATTTIQNATFDNIIMDVRPDNCILQMETNSSGGLALWDLGSDGSSDFEQTDAAGTLYEVFEDGVQASFISLADNIVANEFRVDVNKTTVGNVTLSLNSPKPKIVMGVSGPTITSGSAAPTGTAVNGSLYMRSGGTHAGLSLLYVYDSTTSTWVGIA